MKKIKKLLSFTLVIVMVLTILPYTNISVNAISDNYLYWSQNDASKAWYSMSIASDKHSSCTFARYGCWIMSYNKMLVQSGAVNQDNFGPVEMINWVYQNGLTDVNGNLVGGHQNKIANSFGIQYCGQVACSSYSDANTKIINYVNQGYNIIVRLSGHTVVVDNTRTLQNGYATISNSWTTSNYNVPLTNMSSRYSVQFIDLFKGASYTSSPQNPMTIPTDAWIWSEKTAIATNETVSFNFNAKNATKFVLGIYKDSKEYAIIDNGSSDWYTASFSEPGNYHIHAACYNSNGHCDSNYIYFTVYDNVPTQAWIISNKTNNVFVNEQVVFDFGANNVTKYVIGIYKDSKEFAIIDNGISKQYITSFSEPGNYHIHVACYNKFGHTDSNYIYFTVSERKSFIVSYMPNGGVNAPNTQIKTEGTPLTLSSTMPTRTGYAFLGWATDVNATVAQYSSGGAYTNDADVTLYAVWQKNPATVSSISIQSKPTKIVYIVGETFSSSGLSIKVNMSDGTSKTITDGFTVTVPDMNTAGTKTVNVTYNGVSTSYEITVYDVTLGDLNGNGKVNAADYAMLVNYVRCDMKMPSDEALLSADINKDGTVDAFDAIMIDLYLNDVIDL